MAHLASPRESPVMPAKGRPRYLSAHSPSPPPQSKRDKRMNHLSAKLQDIVKAFSEQHGDHYYAQLSALQCDMNLIMRADPHASGPMDTSPEAIAAQVASVREELNRRKPLHPDAEESFAAMSGRMYVRFVEEVNKAMEERDQDLTMLMNEYQDGIAELKRTNQYKMQLAREEHALLSKTLRERLIQSVTQRRSKLMRDKEQLDIADSSALLLNPNQFSLGNPASPGGAQNRKTRHTRLRADNEDVGALAIEGNKRKRKTAFEETENDSPGPSSRIGENGLANPFREAKAKMNYAQFEAPLFSIERLFSTKDLDLHIDKAHKATFAYFTRLRAQNGQASATGVAPATKKDGEAGEVNQESDAAAAAALASLEAADEIENFGPSPSLLSYLPQKTSQTYHATRSQRNTGLDLLSSAATSTTPFMAGMHAAAGKSNPAAPGPSILEEAFVGEDLELMQLTVDTPDLATLQQRSLDKTSVLSLGVGLEIPANTKQEKDRTRNDASNGQSGAAPSAALASTPMSKTNSTGGISQAGQSMGAVDMRRTASSRRA